MHGRDGPRGQRKDALTRLARLADNLVIDVSDIPDIRHCITIDAKPALNYVEGDEGSGMAKMGHVLNGQTADVHANMPRINGNKVLLLARERVINFQHLGEAGGDPRKA